MIDIHTHFFPPGSFTTEFLAQAQRAKGGAPIQIETDWNEYWRTAPDISRAVVFGGKARLSGMWVHDRDVAALVARYPDKLIGFLSVDPTQPDWETELRHGHEELKLCGIKLLPMYAGFYPQDSKLDSLWKYAQQHHLPVLLHAGTTFISQAPLDCTLPRHIDSVATRYPDLPIILAHLGHPYESECIATIRKHPNVFADISALHYRPWQLFHSLMLVQEYGVWDKLIFGTDFPFTTVDETVEGLTRLCAVEIGGFSLCADRVQNLIHHDPLAQLGLTSRHSA